MSSSVTSYDQPVVMLRRGEKNILSIFFLFALFVLGGPGGRQLSRSRLNIGGFHGPSPPPPFFPPATCRDLVGWEGVWGLLITLLLCLVTDNAQCPLSPNKCPEQHMGDLFLLLRQPAIKPMLIGLSIGLYLAYIAH